MSAAKFHIIGTNKKPNCNQVRILKAFSGGAFIKKTKTKVSSFPNSFCSFVSHICCSNCFTLHANDFLQTHTSAAVWLIFSWRHRTFYQMSNIHIQRCMSPQGNGKFIHDLCFCVSVCGHRPEQWLVFVCHGGWRGQPFRSVSFTGCFPFSRD